MIVSLSLRLADHLKAKNAGHSVKPKSIAGGSSATDRRARVGIIGAGGRVKSIYLPIFKALHDEFEIVGFTNRSREKSQLLADETGFKFFNDAVSMARETKPDFMLVAISAGAIDTTMPSLIDLKVPLLVETPFSWSVRKGQKALKRIRQLQLTVGVAEQTPHLPLEQLKRQLIDLGLVGRVVAAKNDFAVYDYPGIAALRAYIGSYKNAVRVNATRADFPMSGVGADGPPDGPARERWMQGSVVYDDGTLLIHNYSNEYFDAPWRTPRSLRVYGTSSSIIDDAVIFNTPRGWRWRGKDPQGIF